MSTEVELTYAVLSDAPHQDLESIRRAGIKGYDLETPSSHTLVDCYYDTATGALSASRIALRTRSDDGHALVTLKADAALTKDGVVERFELESPWDERMRADVQERLKKAGIELSARLDGSEDAHATFEKWGLHRIQRRENTRETCEIKQTGDIVAELALDKVSFGIAGLLVRHAEIEIEADPEIDHGSEVVAQIGQALHDRWPGLLVLWPFSKLELGKGLERWHQSRPGVLHELIGRDGYLRPEVYQSLRTRLDDARAAPL